jgi:hypothetical protein
MSHLPPLPPPPPPLSARAKESFLRLTEQAKSGKFEPFHLNKPKRSYPKKGKLPSDIRPVSITPRMLQTSRDSLKELRGIAKVPFDMVLANARDSLRPVYHHQVGTFQQLPAAAAAPLGHPPLAFKITPKNRLMSHHGGSKKRSRKHKKSHRKKSHKRSHKRH